MGSSTVIQESSSAMLDVSVIIVNYNTLEVTAKCIDSIYEKTEKISFEVIVVDNASNDGSKDFFGKDHRIKYIYNDENLGFGKANNLALNSAEGRNILFLNSDTLLINNAIKILSDFLDSHPRKGACGGNLFNFDMMPTHSYKKRYYSIWSELNCLLHCIPTRILKDKNDSFNNSGNPIEVAYVTGADLMVKKRVLDETGSFCPDFFMYFEDEELCRRIRNHGWKICSVPDAWIMHLEGWSSEKHSSTRKNPMYQESRKKYLEKIYGTTYRKLTDILCSKVVLKLFLVKEGR